MKRVLATLGVLGGVGLAALFEAVWPLTPTLQKASDRLLLSGREWTCVSLRETPGSDPEQPSASSKTDKG